MEIREANRGLYAAVIDGRVAVKLGSRDWSPGHGWQLAPSRATGSPSGSAARDAAQPAAAKS